MEKRQFGNTDMVVSLLGFGGAEIGLHGAEQREVSQLLGSALDSGLNVIDTAECYGNSEELIGEAVSHRRDEFYLFTKCGHGDNMEGKWDKGSLLQSIERSLKRLRTDVVDLVQLHSCDLAELKKGEVIEALVEARERGYTRYIGYSGDRDEAVFALECGAFDALQTSLSIADQEAIDLTMPLARERNVGVIVKRPIANAIWLQDERPADEYYQAYWDRLVELDYDFLKGDVKEGVGTALRFAASVPGVSTLIVGTRKPGRWGENANVLREGVLPMDVYGGIRKRWEMVAEGWRGET